MDLGTERILIVEDESIVALEISETLKKLGFQSDLIVNSGEKAINTAKSERPDLILMDIHLNGEMNGIEAAGIIRDNFQIPIIFITAFADKEKIKAASQTMPFGYILKPIHEQDLKVTIEMALHMAHIERDRRNAEEKLKFSEAKFRTLFDGMSSGVAIYQPVNDGNDFVFVDFNAAGERIEKVERKNLIGRSVLEVFPGVKTFGLLEVFQRVLQTGIAENHPISFYKDNRISGWRENYIFRLPTGEIAAVYDDTTRRMQAEEELFKSEEKYRELVQSSNSVILKLDKKFRISFLNQFGQDFFGYSEEELIGREIVGTLVPEFDSTGFNLANRMQELCDEPEKYANNENENTCKDGTRVWVAWQNKGIYDDDGVLNGLLCIGNDITKRKAAEEALRKAHDELEIRVKERTVELESAKEEAELANRTKSEFIANISHEVRNPLHHILSFAKSGLKKAGTMPIEKIEKNFRAIQESGTVLLNILNDLLDLSKLSSGRIDYSMKEVRLLDIVRDNVGLSSALINERNLNIRILDPDFDTALICDEDKIGQIVRNLLSNAIKFTPAEKEITISFNKGSLPKGRRDEDQGLVPAIETRVADQGTGIAEEELKSIFDKFIQGSRTKNYGGGTGLGLAICQEIVKAHKGKIWAENRSDSGAVFTFSLPLL